MTRPRRRSRREPQKSDSIFPLSLGPVVKPLPVPPDAPKIHRVVYRHGFLEDPGDLSPLQTVELSGERLPEEIVRSIHENGLLSLGGVHGYPDVGEPIQFDEIRIDYEGGQVEIGVFNRAIMLFKTNDELYVRVHRVCCKIEPRPRYTDPRE